MADSLTATIMAARMNSPSLPLFSPLSLPPRSISFYLSSEPLFFPLVLNRSPLFLFLSAAPHVPTHVLAREIHSPSSGRCSLSSRPLPYLSPCPPHPVSVSGSNSGVSINLAITPRWISENGHVRHGGNGTRLRLYRCIRCRTYVAGAHACMFEGRIGEHAANTASHRPSGVDTNKIRHVSRQRTPFTRISTI